MGLTKADWRKSTFDLWKTQPGINASCVLACGCRKAGQVS
jgi:hypothetical protein